MYKAWGPFKVVSYDGSLQSQILIFCFVLFLFFKECALLAMVIFRLLAVSIPENKDQHLVEQRRVCLQPCRVHTGVRVGLLLGSAHPREPHSHAARGLSLWAQLQVTLRLQKTDAPPPSSPSPSASAFPFLITQMLPLDSSSLQIPESTASLWPARGWSALGW